MKILFLDFDGPLLNPRAHLAFGRLGGLWRDPDPVAANVLQRICGLGEVRIVICASARNTDRVHETIRLAGLQQWLHRSWKTGGSGKPASAITDWLDAHPDVTNWRILEDETHGFTDEMLAHTIKCDGQNGMSVQNIRDLFDWAGVERRGATLPIVTPANEHRGPVFQDPVTKQHERGCYSCGCPESNHIRAADGRLSCPTVGAFTVVVK